MELNSSYLRNSHIFTATDLNSFQLNFDEYLLTWSAAAQTELAFIAAQ